MRIITMPMHNLNKRYLKFKTSQKRWNNIADSLAQV